MLRAHVFTTVNQALFLKQSPGMSAELDGVSFTFGIDVPDDIDVLIVHTRASYSIPTRLTKARTVFVAGEPDVIHPYSRGFLNQFGIVLTPSDVALSTRKLRENCCGVWYAGIDFAQADYCNSPKGFDYFSALKPPAKTDGISVVTSSKTHTEFHRQRIAFIEILKQRIPEHIELFGRGVRSVGDKKDALLPYRYHIALENGGGDFAWTEKLADPLLCWCHPFYYGCNNAADDLPAKAFTTIDITDPDAAINRMMAAVTSGTWEQNLAAIAEARQLLLKKYNQMFLLVRLAKMASEDGKNAPAMGRPRLIRSERSLWPEKGSRGSLAQALVRSAFLRIDPRFELRMNAVYQRIERRRSLRRKRRIERLEAGAEKP